MVTAIKHHLLTLKHIFKKNIVFSSTWNISQSFYDIVGGTIIITEPYRTDRPWVVATREDWIPENFDLLLSGWNFSTSFYPPLPSTRLSSDDSLLRVVWGVGGVVNTRLLGGVLNLEHTHTRVPALEDWCRRLSKIAILNYVWWVGSKLCSFGLVWECSASAQRAWQYDCRGLWSSVILVFNVIGCVC
jgi:hypothetical protein